MRNSSYIETIKKFGLAEYEAKCYLALFEKESLTVSEIASLAGVPRSNIYAIMKKLLVKGLCISLPGGVTKYAPADPGSFRMEMLNSLDDTRKAVDELADNLSNLYKNNSNPLEYIEILKNPEHIRRRYIQLCKITKSEILSLIKPPFASTSPELIKEQENTMLGAMKRGVKVRGVHELPPDEAGREQMYKEINKTYEPEYEEIRLSERLPLKVAIFDGLIAMVTMVYPILNELSLTGLVIDHADYSEGLKTMFEDYWDKGIDYYILDNRKYYLSKQ